MNITPAILIDIAFLAVIAVSVFHYARKGFVSGMIDLVGNLASLALAWLAAGKLSPTVFESFFKSGLIDRTARAIQQQGGMNLQMVLEELGRFLPRRFLEEVAASAGGLLDSGAPDLAQQVVEKVVAPLVVPLISVVVFFATFVLCRVGVALLVTTLTNLNKLPLIGGVNVVFGVCIGLVAGLIYVLLALCLVWAVLVITNGTLPLLNEATLSGSRFYLLFSSYNPFL